MASFINRESILHKNIISYRPDISPNLLVEEVMTQLMACQGFLPFLGTKFSDLLHFQHQCGHSVLYDKESIDSIYDYLETDMDPTIIITKTHPNNTLSPNISVYDFNLLETTPTTQERTTISNNGAAVSWATLSHQKLTTNPNIN